MLRSKLLLAAPLLAGLAACTDDGYGYYGVRSTYSPYSYYSYSPYNGWYDGYYGSIYDGYWGSGETFYFRYSDRDRRYHRGDGRHFRRR